MVAEDFGVVFFVFAIMFLPAGVYPVPCRERDMGGMNVTFYLNPLAPYMERDSLYACGFYRLFFFVGQFVFRRGGLQRLCKYGNAVAGVET